MEVKKFFIDTQNVADYAHKIAGWIKQRVEQTGCKGVVLGMSSGIDCSVVARLCQLAEVEVLLVMMPYGEDMTNTQSMHHALELIEKFNFAYHTFNIQPSVDALTLSLESAPFPVKPESLELSKANIRPRIRMTYLYQLAQLSGRCVIGTGNLAERTVGYFTKWGDGGSDLNPLAMLTKQEVYTLAHFLNIPHCIINKKPSAGLWEGQTDEAELGMTYDQIDAYILQGTSGNAEIDQKIERRKNFSAHKFDKIPIFEG